MSGQDRVQTRGIRIVVLVVVIVVVVVVVVVVVGCRSDG